MMKFFLIYDSISHQGIDNIFAPLVIRVIVHVCIVCRSARLHCAARRRQQPRQQQDCRQREYNRTLLCFSEYVKIPLIPLFIINLSQIYHIVKVQGEKSP